VFSPWYARARRRGAADPEDHCALNVALYGAGGKRWAFTERCRAAVAREADWFGLGPSAVAWEGGTLVARIAERSAPFALPLRGAVRLRPDAWCEESFALDAAGAHVWRPLAPCAHIEVALERPALRWSGRAYLDSNAGDEPLEDAFARWHWSRSALQGGATAVLYDAVRRDGSTFALARRFAPDGTARSLEPPPVAALPPTRWGVTRLTRSEAGAPVRSLQALEDAPFYARSLVSGRLLGETATAVHESLCLDRFRRAWVQALLPFRAPRRAGIAGTGPRPARDGGGREEVSI